MAWRVGLTDNFLALVESKIDFYEFLMNLVIEGMNFSSDVPLKEMVLLSLE